MKERKRKERREETNELNFDVLIDLFDGGRIGRSRQYVTGVCRSKKSLQNESCLFIFHPLPIHRTSDSKSSIDSDRLLLRPARPTGVGMFLEGSPIVTAEGFPRRDNRTYVDEIHDGMKE